MICLSFSMKISLNISDKGLFTVKMHFSTKKSQIVFDGIFNISFYLSCHKTFMSKIGIIVGTEAAIRKFLR